MRRIYHVIEWTSFLLIIVVIGAYAIIGALNSMQDHHINGKKPKKNIVIFYSFGENDNFAYDDFRELVIEKSIDCPYNMQANIYYLNSGTYSEQEMIRAMKRDLNEEGGADLIMIDGDQAMTTALRCNHPMLKSTPLVFCNVHYPDYAAIRKHKNFSGYVDEPDMWENMKLINRLFPGATVEMNYATTELGKIRQNFLNEELKDKPVSITFEKLHENYNEDNTYKKERDHINIDPWSIDLHLVPLNNMPGNALISHFNNTPESNKAVFLMSKFERHTPTVCGLYNRPIVSSIHEGFNECISSVGGYMATSSQIATDWIDMACEVLSKDKHSYHQMIRHNKKCYQFDYNYLNLWNIPIEHLPSNSSIVNKPWNIRYSTLIMMTIAIFSILLISIAYSLYVVWKDSKRQTERNKRLQEEIDGLLTSIENTNINLFYIDNKEILHFSKRQKYRSRIGNDFTLEQIRRYVHTDDYPLLVEAFRKIRENHEGGVIQVRIKTFERKYKWFEARFRAVEKIKNISCSGLIENIDEMKRHEQELLESKHMAEVAETKQSFLDNLSHEIRTPLNAIVGFSSLLCSAAPGDLSPEEKKNLVGIVNHNNDILLALIADILELSRIESGYIKFKYEYCTVNEVLQKVYEDEKPKIKPELYFNLGECKENPHIYTDRLRLEELLHYFINNANKFTKRGGITISARYIADERRIYIYVSDTGKGIEPEQQKMIFKRFYKTDVFEQGTGLGLSICEVIARKLGGKIEVYSQLGKGSTFTVSIPVGQSELEQSLSLSFH